ncbi:flavin-nucleotide-binding protein [Mangrovimicrobium sediminis]|uniref:Flavin-nucleotide-binding protein n=1 Tax=Mangrovimicrobium sediminis TaxID=2562682 RepID=A0A4Z0LZC4_9GAMM|nr:pyridoxamine 5'-phosphate oxidase family protein [Haliea sp. SAOS-164]TGD72536.1 flavin-nucleotide-binding protein [Haliea sp. SAOS-164]
MPTLFHPGELWVQERLGVRESVDKWAGRAIRSRMPDQHRNMFRQLPFLVAAGRDNRHRIWATLLTGAPGFIQSPADTRLHIQARPRAGDALDHAFTIGADIGLLGIDLASRRRNRANGNVTRHTNETIAVGVRQSYGNCPSYITQRQWRPVERAPHAVHTARASSLDIATAAWIRHADTFFIASGAARDAAEAGGLDASHRSGPPGLVEVLSERELLFPDYAGNNFFNTLGNLVLNPNVGLLFIDFEQGSLLQVNGCARIDWDSPEVARRPGAQRLVSVSVEEVVVQRCVLPLRW